MTTLEIVKVSNPDLLEAMSKHYSQPKGFVGRCIPYRIRHGNVSYGFIVGGSSYLLLKTRNEALSMTNADQQHVICNTFYRIERVDGKYPERNFTVKVLRLWMETCALDWFRFYGDNVIGFETLVEPPRTGEIYRRAGWSELAMTKGIAVKRPKGVRLYDHDSPKRPKRLFVYSLGVKPYSVRDTSVQAKIDFSGGG